MPEINIFDPPWSPDFVLSAVQSGYGSCLRCGALVDLELRYIDAHRRWHERIEAVLSSVEYADELVRELRERGDG